MNVIEILQERGFIDKKTHESELYEYIEKGPVVCYIGFDPTASSLHVGSLVPIMSLAHMQRQGHLPIALIGGGTGLVGDPSGKTEMRKLLTLEAVEENIQGIKKQLSRFIDFSNEKALLLNNAEWLTSLRYIQFLREVGRHFSVNRMIKAESYRMRLESDEGLNFVEFNYMLLQAYDFYKLFDKYGCRLQMGGSDQWGNIVAGIELVRRMRQETVFGITFPLITTSTGAKMGKTAGGAVWLEPERTTPYEYYQFWVNTNDEDVARFLALFSFLPMNEIEKIKELEGSKLNFAKTVLAFEATQLAHGREESLKAYQSAQKMFFTKDVPCEILPSSSIPRGGLKSEDISVPHSYFELKEIKAGISAFKLFHLVGLADSSSASRRLIEQGGAYLNGKRIDSIDYLITDTDLVDMEMLLRSGKKRFHKIIIKN